MPNWCFNYGSIDIDANTSEAGKIVYQKLIADVDNKSARVEKWFGRVLPCLTAFEAQHQPQRSCVSRVRSGQRPCPKR